MKIAAGNACTEAIVWSAVHFGACNPSSTDLPSKDRMSSMLRGLQELVRKRTLGERNEASHRFDRGDSDSSEGEEQDD